MKKILLGSAIVLLVSAMSAAFISCSSRARAEGRLQIMYSGNLRGSAAPCGCHTPKGGIPRWAAFMNRYENPDACWLTVDVGNFVDRAGDGGCSNKCRFLLTSYRDLHYDVLNIGKQEAWMGYETLVALRDTVIGAQFISANLINRISNRPLFKPTVVKDYGKLRVGLIGLLSETDFPRGSSLLDSTKLMVAPVMETARKYLPGLIRKADAIVVLCELSSGTIDTLIKTFPQIDLVVSSGSLKSGEDAVTIGKTRVMGTGSSGYSGHYALLEFNPAWKDSAGFSQFHDFLTDSYDEKGLWADRLAAFKAEPQGAPATPAMENPSSPSANPSKSAAILRSPSNKIEPQQAKEVKQTTVN